MREIFKATLTLCVIGALAGCQTTKNVNTESLKTGANNAVDSTVDALNTSTIALGKVDRSGTVTKAPSIADSSDPVSDQNLKDAALSPLEDFNIRRREVPALLTEIGDPYALPADQSCAGYARSVADLDAVLGIDYDNPNLDLTSSDSFNERTKDLGLAGVNSGVGFFIPGRELIAEATGSAPRQRYIRALFQRGVARRGFLKGTARSKGCAS